MKRTFILGVLLYLFSSICLASNSGAIGNFIINNNSSYDMSRIDMQSKMMKTWSFPQTISAHQSSQSNVGFIVPWLGIPGDDYGVVSYQITCAAGKQVVGFYTTVDWKLVNVKSNPKFEANFIVQSSGANCVTVQPANGASIAFQQNGNSVLTLSDSH